MKQTYICPEMEVKLFAGEDIVTTSIVGKSTTMSSEELTRDGYSVQPVDLSVASWVTE